jgi:hypothetical protein
VSDFDEDLALDDDSIGHRWPVALGISPGFSESISGQIDHEPSVCGYNPHSFVPLPKPEPKGCQVWEAERQANLKGNANAVFANANQLAKKRLADKNTAEYPTWTPAARAARSAYLKRCARERAEWDRENKHNHEQYMAENAAAVEAHLARIEKAKIPCSANECEMGEWIQLDWRQFHDLMGRKATTLETRAVRGCAHCPRIESKLAPHFGAL